MYGAKLVAFATFMHVVVVPGLVYALAPPGWDPWVATGLAFLIGVILSARTAVMVWVQIKR